MSFLINNEKLLEKYTEIWKKVSNIIKKEFDSKPVYNEKYLKTKIKSYNEKVLRARKFHLPKYMNFFLLLNYKKFFQSGVFFRKKHKKFFSGKIFEAGAGKFHFLKYKKKTFF